MIQAVGILIGLSAFAAFAQEVPLTPLRQYSQTRPSGDGFVRRSAQTAAGAFILDLRPEEEFNRSHVVGARNLSLRQLLDPSLIAVLPRTGAIYVVASDDSLATEAMVLLRVAGYPAFAALGGVVTPQRQEARAPDGRTSTTGKDPVQQKSDGSSGRNAPRAPDGPSRDPEFSGKKTSDDAGRVDGPRAPVAPQVVAAVAGSLAALGVALLYFLVIAPSRRARPLRQAVQMIARPSPNWEEVERLLALAVAAGLRSKDLDEARFLLAYARCLLGRFAEASGVLTDLIHGSGISPEALYLDLWLKVRQKQYEQAERLFDQHSERLRDYPRAKELAGVALLELGRLNLSRREIDSALGYFQRLRVLGVFGDQIPADIDDHEIALAIEALFEKNNPQARERFTKALRNAEGRGAPTMHARIGLLVCDWKEQEIPDIEDALGQIVREVAKPPEKGAVSDPLVTHVLVWHAVSLLFRWMTLPMNGGLPREEVARLNERLGRLREVSPEAPDADLIAGLIGYYFAKDDTEREDAVAVLKAGAEKGLSVPEVNYLVECEDRLAQLREERRDNYLKLLRTYLTNPAVDIELRRELHEHLRQFDRYKDLGEVNIEAPSDATAPSIQDLAASCALIERRVRNIFRGYEGKAPQANEEEIQGLLEHLGPLRERINETVADLGKTEQKLMRVAGEALLPEESSDVVATVTGEAS